MEPRLPIAIDFSDVPSRGLSHSLYGTLRGAIADGRLAAGLRLPSTRELAQSLGVARNTVIIVYDRLSVEGYIESRRGVGVFVTRHLTLQPAATPPTPQTPERSPHLDRHIRPLWQTAGFWPGHRLPIDFDFYPGFPDTHHFPMDIWRSLCARAGRAFKPGERAYMEAQGRAGLREAIARHLSFARAIACGPGDILVTAGTQQAMDLLSRVLVTPGRTTVAVEEPCYIAARRTFQVAGARLVHVPVDDEGMIVDLIPDDVDIISVTPSHQFPLGCAMSARRRMQLVDFARSHGAVILEDDYQGEFRYAGKPLDALQTLDRDQSVFYIGTFSKSMFPEVRLGFIVMPSWAASSLLAAKQIADLECQQVPQDALAAFISEGHLARHVRKMHKVYAHKREIVTRALRDLCGDWIGAISPEGGIHLTVALKPEISGMTVQIEGPRQGLRLWSLGGFYADPKTARNGLALGFGRLPADRLEPGIVRLAALMQSVAR